MTGSLSRLLCYVRGFKMPNKYNNRNETKDNHTFRTILVFFICLFIGLCGFLAIRLLTLHDNEYINTRAIVFDEDAEDIVPETNHALQTIIPCWDSMVFKANTVEQDVNFYNPESNNGINFKIKMMTGDNVIYESDLIAPGKSIKHIQITKPMQPQYISAYILYECYANDGTKLNGSKMNFTLKVEE